MKDLTKKSILKLKQSSTLVINEKCKKLIKTFILGVEKYFGIKKDLQYVTITEHKGVEFNFYEKSLSDWIKNDDPANR